MEAKVELNDLTAIIGANSSGKTSTLHALQKLFGRGAFWNFRKNPEEDTCTFFVALSRAKRRVIFTFCQIREVGFNSNQVRHNIGLLYNLLNRSNIVQEKNFFLK